jgi:hypothetical protein
MVAGKKHLPGESSNFKRVADAPRRRCHYETFYDCCFYHQARPQARSSKRPSCSLTIRLCS